MRDSNAKDRLEGRLRGWNNTHGMGSNYEIREREQHGWVPLHEPSGWPQFPSRSIGERKLVTSPPNEPLVLLRLRTALVYDAAEEEDLRHWEYEAIEGPRDGLLLWISNFKE